MKLFIAGGTGFVGSEMVKALAEKGHEVHCLARNPSRLALPKGARPIEGDALKPEGLAEKLSGFDAAINLIGIIRAFPEKGITFRRFHVDATFNMLEAAKKAGIRRFIQMSANGAKKVGVAEYQTTKYEGEEAVRSSGLEYTIFRPSVIFGRPAEGKMEFCTQLAGVIRSAPVIPVFGNGMYRMQPINVRDVAEAFAGAVERPETAGRVFHLGGEDSPTYREILDLIAAGMGKRPKPKIPVPWGMVRPVVKALERFAFFPATHYQIEMLMEGNTVPETGFKEVFGISPIRFTVENLSYLRG